MKKFRDIFLQASYFFGGLVFFFTISLFFLEYNSRGHGFLFLVPYHTEFLDHFFIAYTNLGNGFFFLAVIGLFLVMGRFRFALQLLATFLISGLLVQVLKNLVYSPRPKEFFKLKEHIYLIDGVTLTGNSSFPSGHTASAFALATLLALSTSNKKISCLYLAAAVLVGYSRIYLSQHFPADVIGGAAIGVFVALLLYIFFNPGKKKNRG